MPLHRRLPKRGFTNLFRKEYRTVNVDRLNAFDAGSRGRPRRRCRRRACCKKGDGAVKVLGNGELKVALTVRAHKFTKAGRREDRGGRRQGRAARSLSDARSRQR